MDQHRIAQRRIQPYHFCGEIENKCSLIAALCRREDLTVGTLLCLWSTEMHQEDARDQRRLAVLPAERKDRAPGDRRIVVDREDELALPMEQFDLLADMRAFRNVAVSLDPFADMLATIAW